MGTFDASALGEFIADGRLELEHVPSKKHPAQDGGATYVVPSPSGREGLYLMALADDIYGVVGGNGSSADRLKLNDDEERDFYRLALGCDEQCGRVVNETEIDEAIARLADADDVIESDVVVPEPQYAPKCGSAFDKMAEDGVNTEMLKRLALYAFNYFGINADFANQQVQSQLKSQAPANRKTRRAAQRAKPAKKTTPRKRSSAPKGGSGSTSASGGASTPASRATTRGSSAPAKKLPTAKAS